jgi:hypothetical protein
MSATSNDAQLILQLYDLRREAVMRNAREFVGLKFWPTKAEEVLTVMQGFGTQESAYLRQVISYWEMATALVNHGTINSALFADCVGEAVFIYAKFHPFLAEIRETMNPDFMKQVEQYIQSSPVAKANLERTLPRIAEWTKGAKEAAHKAKKEAAAD